MSTTETDRERILDAEARRSRSREPADREPESIEREIDATRADMRATLEALEHRFSFDRLIDQLESWDAADSDQTRRKAAD